MKLYIPVAAITLLFITACGQPTSVDKLGSDIAAESFALEDLSPPFKVIGVYHIPISSDLLFRQAQILHSDNPTPAELAETREYLSDIVLVEVAVEDDDVKFDFIDFRQGRIDQPQNEWQVAWDERYLSEDGTAYVARPYRKPVSGVPRRFIFNLHNFDETLPIHLPDGSKHYAVPRPLPDRLYRIYTYTPLG